MALLACAAALEPQESLRVTAVLPATTAQRGTVFTIAIEVSNTSGRAVSLRATSGCFTDFEVLGASNDTVLGRSGQQCMQEMTSRSLGAGESFTVQHNWTPGALGQLSLPPGAYRMRGVLLLEGEEQTSEAVPFTIAPL